MNHPICFLELPAGLASVSLRLHGGPGCRPLISRMGNKAGYAEVILWTLGLRAGHGADAYLWAEADEDVAALLRCYPDAAMLRAVADIIRGWKDEEPRALWERLRAERKTRGPQVDAEGTAMWMTSTAWGATGQYCGPDRGSACGSHPPGWVGSITADGMKDRCHRLAEYAQIASANRLINVAGPDLRNTGKGGTTHGGAEFATPAGELADRFEAVAEQVAAHVVEHAGTHPGGGGFRGLHVNRPNVDGFIPSRDGLADGFDAAATVLLHKWSFNQCGPEHGYGGPGSVVKPNPATNWTTENRDQVLGCERIAGRMAAAPTGWPRVAVLPRIPAAADVARWLGTPCDLDGCVAYLDPPYQNTTGYAHNLTREEVVSIAIEYASMGAHVAISEAVPLPELVALSWHVADITGERKGQKRTFSKQQSEYLTMNRPAAYRVATQSSLFTFGAAK